MSAREEQSVSSSIFRQPVNIFRHYAAKYEDVIVKDPDFTFKLESLLKVASYIIPGRLGGSWEFSEVAFSVSNLYSLGNDYLIARKCPGSCQITKYSKKQQRLLWLLTLLDYVEVAIEVMTQRYAGEPAKWGVVILMQLVRAILRYLLVFKYGHGLISTPAVPSPDRKAAQALHSNPPNDSEGHPLAWRAPRTGKIIRSIYADDSVLYSQLHHYVTPTSPSTGQSGGVADSMKRPLGIKQMVAEILYISRPLVHIFSMFVFSSNSWKPWMLSLAGDILSLQLLGSPTSYLGCEKSEVTRRRVVLLLYLLRSPFYDSYTKSILIQFLKGISNKFPFLQFIIKPALEYLPVWQQTYSYNWMT